MSDSASDVGERQRAVACSREHAFQPRPPLPVTLPPGASHQLPGVEGRVPLPARAPTFTLIPASRAVGGGGHPRGGFCVCVCVFRVFLKQLAAVFDSVTFSGRSSARGTLWGYFGPGIIGNYYILCL